jgi:hypothetical protein
MSEYHALSILRRATVGAEGQPGDETMDEERARI